MCACVRVFLGDPVNHIHFLLSSEPGERGIERSQTDGEQNINCIVDKPRLDNGAFNVATETTLHLVPKGDRLSDLVAACSREADCPARSSKEWRH